MKSEPVQSKPAPVKAAEPKQASIVKEEPILATKPVSQAPIQSIKTSPLPSSILSNPDAIPGLLPGQRQERRVKMNRMRLRIAERLKDSQNTAASLTTFNEIDMRFENINIFLI